MAIVPTASDVPAFLDSGRSLAMLPIPTARPVASLRVHALGVPDVAASLELGLIAPADAGVIAEERGAPGGDLQPSNWVPQPTGATTDALPSYLAHRFGPAPQRLHLVVDATRPFSVGTLVYSNTAPRDPEHAIGVVIEAGSVGGVALIAKSSLRLDRFIVELPDGPSPARIKRA